MPDLLPHQSIGIDWLADRPLAILADEPGLGKTRTLLEAAVEPVLVTAPSMVLEAGVWTDEIARWTPGLEVTQVPYSMLSERQSTGRKSGSRPTGKLRPEWRKRWGTVICDESHNLKGRKTGWTKSLAKIKTDRLWQATGTPLPNWAEEAFISARMSHEPGDLRFTSYWRWAKEWFDVGATTFSPMAVGEFRRDRTWAEFQSVNWGDRMLLRTRDEWLDLPPLNHREELVDMEADQSRIYNELKHHFVTWLDNGREVVAWNHAAQLVKLCKAATGLEVLDPEIESSAKLERVRELAGRRTRPTLLVGHFQDSVNLAAQAIQQEGGDALIVHGAIPIAKRRDAVAAFRRGEVGWLCATIDTIREGMNLTVSDALVRLERSFVPSRNDQVVHRLHRLGQHRTVQVLDLLSRDTIDVGIAELVAKKRDHQAAALPRGELRSMVT